ncbi:MAG TPA: hypothetical protein VK465_09930, partial [Fibrobacteria bacterium]|nr:hypothetical protein [Fibrobacteria bacterium]
MEGAKSVFPQYFPAESDIGTKEFPPSHHDVESVMNGFSTPVCANPKQKSPEASALVAAWKPKAFPPFCIDRQRFSVEAASKEGAARTVVRPVRETVDKANTVSLEIPVT